MDANGSRYHLIYNEQDWSDVSDHTPGGVGSRWIDDPGYMGLKPELSVFPRGSRITDLDLTARRDAACDRFGTWYWIAQDRQSLMRAPASSGRAQVFWRQPGDAGTSATAGKGGAFQPDAPTPQLFDLAGAAITARHYLIVGIMEPAGLLVFDLHAGGEPLHIVFPSSAAFQPFDLAPSGDGGVWVLDRNETTPRLWGLDRFFRLLPLTEPVSVEPLPGSFSAHTDAETPSEIAVATPPSGLPLPATPVAVEALPNGGVLILVEPAQPGQSSRLLYYAPGSIPGVLVPPPAAIPVPSLDSVTVDPDSRPVVGHDMALMPDENKLVIVEREGNQAFAFSFNLNAPDLDLEPSANYLPMHHFGGRSLAQGVTTGGLPSLFYDVTPQPEKDSLVRWIRLHEIDRPRFARTARLRLPVFDSRQRSATWHRLFLDACIPPETAVEVWTRAGDDEDLLEEQSFIREPMPYLRSQGAEIPFWDHWVEVGEEASHPEHTGTWEVLFQRAQGRFIQVRLVLTGNGRATPQIYGVRTYYPRFSYVTNYLPSAYQEVAESAHFLERFLANLEGFYTDLEGRITASSALFDPRSAPPDTLNWLAAWLGLVLDPLWTSVGDDLSDRRRLMIRFARRLYERRGTLDGIRFALMLFLDPCLEETLARLERATVTPDPSLTDELARFDLPTPQPDMPENEIENLLYSYVLSAPGRSRVRIVEHWQSRLGLTIASGDITRLDEATTGFHPAPDSSKPCQPPYHHPDCRSDRCKPAAADVTIPAAVLYQAIVDAAHRFSVLIPEDLPTEEAAMVEKIIQLEKPAHTDYDLRRFWDYFLVGQVRLGIDTVLGEDSRFLPIILGGGIQHAVLSAGYLEAAHPMNIAERTVADRDRLGEMNL